MDADHGFPSRVKSDRLGMLLSDRHGCYYVIGMNVIERSPCVGICSHGHVPLVPILIAVDRYENEADAVLLDKSYQQIAPALQPLLSRGSILCTDGNQSYIQIAEEVAGIFHKRLIISKHHRVEDEVYHIQTLNNYVSRWRGWMQKFHGVGTDYLKNYLAWFRVYNQEPNSAKSWLSGGVKIVNNT